MMSFLSRQIAPPSHAHWLSSQEDEAMALEEDLATWRSSLSDFEKLAAQRLYHNSDFTEVDLRCHRMFIFALLAEIEQMGINACRLLKTGQIDEARFTAYIGQTDQYSRQLQERFLEWHGTIDQQTDIPDELKKSFGELDRGETISLDEALG